MQSTTTQPYAQDAGAPAAVRPTTRVDALALGAVGGVFGGAILLVIESVDRVATLWPSFNTGLEPAVFCLYLAPVVFLGLAAGLVIGPSLAVLGAVVGALDRALAGHLGRASFAIACTSVAAAIALVAGVGLEIARRQLGLRSFHKVAATISLYFMDADAPLLSRIAHAASGWVFPILIVLAFGIALAVAALPRLVTPGAGSTRSSVRYASAATVAIAILLVYAFDSRFEFARYDMFLHVPAAVLQCALAYVAAAILLSGRSRLTVGAVRGAVVVLSIAVLASAFAWLHIGANENLKTLLWRRSVVARRAYAVAVALADRDGDGFAGIFAGADLDDRNPAVNPLATEIPGNGLDDNCIGGDLAAAEPRAPVATTAPAARGRKFVLIAVDTLRADRMSLYGYDRPTTPRLDEHAASGLVFEACQSQGTNTAVAFAAMQTSATRGGVFEPERDRLFPRLAAAGFATAQVNAVEESIWLRAKSSSRPYRKVILDGIDTFPHEFGEQFWDADTVTDEAIKYFSSLPPDRPSATWVHYFDPHTPRRKMAPFDYGDTASDRYDSEVAFSDREVGRLLDWMRTSGFMDDAVVVFTADHGEAFLEHGMDFHGNRPYAEQIHIPLVVWAPGLAPGRTSAPASIVDVAPTALEFLGLPPLVGAEGISLLSPGRADRAIFSETPLNIVDGPFFAYAVTKDGWKLIYDVVGNTTELYDLTRDPRELRNRADTEPERVASLRATLARWLDTTRSVESAAAALELMGE